MRLTYFLVVCALIVAVAVLPYATPEFDFTLSTSETQLSITDELFARCIVNVTLTRGLSQPVSLNVSGLSEYSRVSYSFKPASGNPTFSSILTFNVTWTGWREGIYQLTITGTGGGKTHSTPIILRIQTHWH